MGEINTRQKVINTQLFIDQYDPYKVPPRQVFAYYRLILTHISLASLLWDIGKQNSPRCDAAECGVPSGAILFA